MEDDPLQEAIRTMHEIKYDCGELCKKKLKPRLLHLTTCMSRVALRWPEFAGLKVIQEFIDNHSMPKRCEKLSIVPALYEAMYLDVYEFV